MRSTAISCASLTPVGTIQGQALWLLAKGLHCLTEEGHPGLFLAGTDLAPGSNTSALYCTLSQSDAQSNSHRTTPVNSDTMQHPASHHSAPCAVQDHRVSPPEAMSDLHRVAAALDGLPLQVEEQQWPRADRLNCYWQFDQSSPQGH